MSTNTAKSCVVKELNSRYGLKSVRDGDNRLRHVWRRDSEGKDWLVIGAREGGHFDLRKNILEEISLRTYGQKTNPLKLAFQQLDWITFRLWASFPILERENALPNAQAKLRP